MTQEQTQILESELLKDPLNDRKVKEVPLPPQVPLNIQRVYGSGDIPNYKLVKEYLQRQGKLSKELAMHTLKSGGAILSKEPNLLKIEGAVTIFGDIHG